MAKRRPNLLFFGVDSLRRDHMSLYGYPRLTSPHLAKFAAGGTVFENCFSPSVPTTSGYAIMMTGRDCFGTNVVALRHGGPMADGVTTLTEVLKAEGYEATSVNLGGEQGGRGFEKVLNYQGWGNEADGRAHKAANLNAVTIPELKRLAAAGKPFFLFLRHMDPHSPYRPPPPFERMFYGANECEPGNKSMDPVFEFKPFCDYFASWMPQGITDKEYVIAQYDGEVAYMDACIQNIFATLTALGLDEDTLVVFTSDHGETLYDHDCFFDHHGIYDPTLVVPLFFRLPGRVPAGLRLPGYTTLADVTPTVLDIMGIKTKAKFDGQSLFGEMNGKRRIPATEFYITEATWMRKHGWRTPEWKLIHALEPDFHFKPEVELYNLAEDPEENNNLAKKERKVVAMLEGRMQDWIARREKETGRKNPMYTNLLWHGFQQIGGPFKTSQQAYDMLRIGDVGAAQKLQARGPKA